MANFSDEWQSAEDLTFKYVHDSFAKGEAIWFSLVKTDRDSQRMDAIIAEHGGDTAALPDRIRAMVVACARRWTLKLPKSFLQPVLDEDGEPTHDADGNAVTEPHPLAGKVPPLNWEYVTRLPDFLLRDIAQKISEHYAGELTTRRSVKSIPSATEGASPPEVA